MTKTIRASKTFVKVMKEYKKMMKKENRRRKKITDPEVTSRMANDLKIIMRIKK